VYDLLSVAVLYLLALIGCLFLVAVILGLYLAYRYDISFSIHSKTGSGSKLAGKPSPKGPVLVKRVPLAKDD
jgi:hypothetical protein